MWAYMRRLWRQRNSAAALGIDFSANLNVAELVRVSGANLMLRQFAIEDGSWVAEAASSQKAGELLRDALGRNGMHAEFAVAGIGEEYSSFQLLHFPSMSTKELLEAVRWELQPFLTEDAKQYYYDAAVLERAPSAEGMLVFAAAALKERVDWLAATASEAGIKLAVVEPEAVALARANGAQEEALLVKVEGEHSYLYFVHGGVPVSVETMGSYGEGPSSVSEFAADLAERLAAYQALHIAYRPHNICFSGTSLQGDALGRLVAAQTGVPVRLALCWQQVAAAPSFDEVFLEEAAPTLALPVGLAMRGVQVGLH